MEQDNVELIPQPEALQVVEKAKKPLIPIIVAVILVGVLAGAIYYCGTVQCINFNSQPTNTKDSNEFENLPTKQAIQPSVAPTEIIESAPTGLPPSNTVGFMMRNNTPYLSYRGKIHKESENYQIQTANLSNPDDYIWERLVEAPLYTDAHPGEMLYDELFSFKMMPDRRRFMFVMRWSEEVDNTMNQTFNVYYFDPDAYEKTKLVYSSPNDFSGLSQSIPQLGEFSQTGRYVYFDMFGCWNCGGHPPTKLLVNTSDWNNKDIGRVAHFKWGDEAVGAYEYKDYIAIECAEPGPGECIEDPDNLPLKNDVF